MASTTKPPPAAAVRSTHSCILSTKRPTAASRSPSAGAFPRTRPTISGASSAAACSASSTSLVGVGQGEAVLEERPAAAERREAEACVAQKVFQLAPAELRRRAHADLDAFEAELARHESRLAHATGEQHRAEARGPRRGREARRPAHA